MKLSIMQRLRLRRRSLAGLWCDQRGIAATEFAVIVPVMLSLFFGVVEFSQGVALNRKVTIVARTLSDLVSQNISVTDANFTSYNWAGTRIVDPYSSTPLHQTVSELYVDPSTHTAKVMWSNGYAPRSHGSVVTVPAALTVDGTYLIFSEIAYLYTPTVSYGYAAVNLTDVAYTRPRQSTCVLYNVSQSTPCPTS
jgi:Flp pilus assembly protein TadG